MLDAYEDDARLWMNFRSEPSAAERETMRRLFENDELAERWIAFGLRPASVLDDRPDLPASKPSEPFEVMDEHIEDPRKLVDIQTGHRFVYDADSKAPWFDLVASNNVFDACELLTLAANRCKGRLPFQTLRRRTMLMGVLLDDAPIVPPLDLSVDSREALESTLESLEDCFCGKCGANRLWFRGQTREHAVPGRESALAFELYGHSDEPSLVPSIGRQVASMPPGELGFGFAFAGPKHAWKKPFLIWMMRDNDHWFRGDPRFREVLDSVLADKDDMRFSRLLGELSLPASLLGDSSVSQGLDWPVEADDLRQWFFAFMKRYEFAVTLQQYGYVTSLLDLTESLDVALYFTQARRVDGKMRREKPGARRVLYVFAERKTGDFFRHGVELFWGDEDWVRNRPPRLAAQRAGFLFGSSCRARNFYAQMLIARIRLQSPAIETTLCDADLFPYETDLLYQTLRDARPEVEGLY